MSKFSVVFGTLILLISTTQVALAQNEYSHPNNVSVLTAVPRGCLDITPSLLEVPNRQVLVDGIIQQNVANSSTLLIEQVDIRVRIWRHGCHDPDRSAILMNLSLPRRITTALETNLNMNPIVSLRDGEESDLSLNSALWEANYAEIFARGIGTRGYSDSAFPNGVTYILDTSSFAVESSNFDKVIERYNNGGQLRLQFPGQIITADIPPYNPSFDPPQQPKPSFTGRMTGSWIADNLPSTGLLIQVGEVPKQNRNFIFAIWFTYIDGQPVWVAGNKDITVGANEVTLDMSYFEGGKLFTSLDGFDSADISSTPVGTMTLKVINCNQVEVTTDFSSSGLGSNALVLDRLIRIAGFDCDGTQAIK